MYDKLNIKGIILVSDYVKKYQKKFLLKERLDVGLTISKFEHTKLLLKNKVKI